ncbi:hypothetical protein [Ensifer sp.]|jgi:hypothetical protein|uniref:hypothetical protein n=1 Tax=Ensifer sp. TaxID=1872086 RepID=UPI002E0D1A98|nr:hypothetical protein [Ensifer sp.]
MWKMFAVIYGVGFVLGLIVIANLLLANPELQLTLAFAGLICAGVAIAFLTLIGLLAYAFNLTVRPIALWRPFGRLLAIWLAGVSLVGAVNLMPQPSGQAGIASMLWLLLALLVNYFSWLGVWRYARRVAQQPARAT